MGYKYLVDFCWLDNKTLTIGYFIPNTCLPNFIQVLNYVC